MWIKTRIPLNRVQFFSNIDFQKMLQENPATVAEKTIRESHVGPIAPRPPKLHAGAKGCSPAGFSNIYDVFYKHIDVSVPLIYF